MNSITVRKSDLLAALHKNRELHRKIFLEAQEGFREAVIKRLDELLAAARKGQYVEQHLNLIEPMDQTGDYDRVIKMMEYSTKDEVELSESDFACYVLDDWKWKHQWMLSNSNYSATLKRN